MAGLYFPKELVSFNNTSNSYKKLADSQKNMEIRVFPLD
jgi:hypothetical protein